MNISDRDRAAWWQSPSGYFVTPTRAFSYDLSSILITPSNSGAGQLACDIVNEFFRLD